MIGRVEDLDGVVEYFLCSIRELESERVSGGEGRVNSCQLGRYPSHELEQLQAVLGMSVGKDLEVIEVAVVGPAGEDPDGRGSGFGDEGRQLEADHLGGAGRSWGCRVGLPLVVLLRT